MKAQFDLARFYDALDRARQARRVSWREIGRATGVSSATLSRIASGRHPDCASLAALSAWAGINPAKYSLPPAQVARPAGQVEYESWFSA